MRRYRMSIDVGGTFTDLMAISDEGGEIVNLKVSSTPRDPAMAIVEVLKEFLKKNSGAEISVVVHATTIATNSLLGQQSLELPRTALMTTEGFRDIIEIGRQRRHQLYDLFIQKPRKLIPRRLCLEVSERIGPKGQILIPLHKSQVEDLTQRLRNEKVDSVAVALLFSHLNPKHEREIGKILRKQLPKVYVSLSSEIAPEYREYERTSTTVVNAVIMPLVSRYLDELQKGIRKTRSNAPLCVMQSDGGIATKETISKKPVSIVESGPAAGVIASAFYGKLLGIRNILSFDMGGTTAKAGAIKETKPEVVGEYEVGGKVHSGRIVKGSGYPVRYPFIDLAECSAGGGTIAWVDEGGALQVGPTSAGAEPGPAGYGRGGKQPTITDANIVLGRLNPKYMLGGKLKIYPILSEKAIREKICSRIGLELTDAASGITKIANSAMAKILRMVSVERGHDPRDFILMCFGGAGPMHGCALAEELRIKKIIVPPNPGLFSAFGLSVADFRNSKVKAIMKLIDNIDLEKIESDFQGLELQGAGFLEKQNIPKENMHFVRQMDLRYFGQSYELTISTLKPTTEENLQKAIDDFKKRHRAVYGFAAREEPVELVNLNLVAVGVIEKPKLSKTPLGEKKPPRTAVIGKRKVLFETSGDHAETPIYAREKLKPGNRLESPAVIEQYDATTVVYPGWIAHLDEFGNIIISTEKGGN